MFLSGHTNLGDNSPEGQPKGLSAYENSKNTGYDFETSSINQERYSRSSRHLISQCKPYLK